jgi:hypothetical protein
MHKIHNHRQPAGLERTILRQIPKVILGAVFIPLFMSVFSRLFPISGSAADIAKYQIGVDIFGISIGIMVITAVFTVTIGCIIVVLMKGPAYVADAYELDDSEQPASRDKTSKH